MRVMWIKGEPYKYNQKHAGGAEHFQDFNTEEEREQFLKDFYLVFRLKKGYENFTNAELERIDFIKDNFPEYLI